MAQDLFTLLMRLQKTYSIPREFYLEDEEHEEHNYTSTTKNTVEDEMIDLIDKKERFFYEKQ